MIPEYQDAQNVLRNKFPQLRSNDIERLLILLEDVFSMDAEEVALNFSAYVADQALKEETFIPRPKKVSHE